MSRWFFYIYFTVRCICEFWSMLEAYAVDYEFGMSYGWVWWEKWGFELTSLVVLLFLAQFSCSLLEILQFLTSKRCGATFFMEFCAECTDMSLNVAICSTEIASFPFFGNKFLGSATPWFPVFTFLHHEIIIVCTMETVRIRHLLVSFCSSLNILSFVAFPFVWS